MATLATTVDIASLPWVIGDLVTGTRGGGKSATITQPSGPIRFQLCPLATGLRAPWGASSCQGQEATKLNLDLSLDSAELLAWCDSLDEWLVATITEHSERLFKKRMTEQQVRAQYRPLVARKEGSSYAPTLKTKINLSSVRCWTPAGERIEASEVNWKRSLLCPCVSVRQLWFVSRLVGLTLDVTDVVVHPSEEESFPFM